MMPIIDVITPCHAENPQALRATIAACLQQNLMPRKIYIVDDGSPTPVVLPPEFAADERVELLRLDENRGISAARNAAAARSDADYLFFLNCEILPDPNWLQDVTACMEADATIGAACGRARYYKSPRPWLTAWRMRIMMNHEERAKHSGFITFASGHAVLVRRFGFEAIGGYDEKFRRAMEDSDLCNRLMKRGFGIYFVATACCASMQKDTLLLAAKKSLRNCGWTLDPKWQDDAATRLLIPRPALASQTRLLKNRLKRNLGRGRLHFVPIDILVWLVSLRLIWNFRRAARAQTPKR